MSAGVYVKRGDRYWMAHPASPRVGEDWPHPLHPRIQYALAVGVQVLVILAVMVAILALGAVVGAATGWDMGPLQ
jgi:hypothetical protein